MFLIKGLNIFLLNQQTVNDDRLVSMVEEERELLLVHVRT